MDAEVIEVSGRVGVSPAGLGILPKRSSEADSSLSLESKACSGETPEPAGRMPTLPETTCWIGGRGKNGTKKAVDQAGR